MQKKVPWLQHHLQSQVCKSALALYINFQGEHLYRAGEMENMHPLRPLILKFTACLSTSSFFRTIQATEEMKAEGGALTPMC